MKQEQTARFTSENGKVSLICDGDTALGDLHDFLMAVKGEIVNRMVEAQKAETKERDSKQIPEVEAEVNEEK